jgi:hypothetical protein|nr:MAG TPA: hypothetical protein [Caudoviricetes sp.]
MERKKIIVVTPEEAKYLVRLFNVSSVTVWAALKYRKSNPIHKKIRKAAIERGGQQMVLTPEFEAIYITNRQDADKGMTRYMVQPFENGATIEGNFKTGLVIIRDKNGQIRGEWNSPRLSELAAIQEVAQSL